MEAILYSSVVEPAATHCFLMLKSCDEAFIIAIANAIAIIAN